MTEAEAEKVRIGDTVLCSGRLYTATAIKLGLIAGPHFRLSPLGHDVPEVGLTSYRLLSMPPPEPKCVPPGSIRTAIDVNIDNGTRFCGMCTGDLAKVKLGENCPVCHYKLGWFQILTDVTAIGDQVKDEAALVRYIAKYKAKQRRDEERFGGPLDGPCDDSY